VEVPYVLSKYDPHPLRFYLIATAPETRDTEFSWEDFVERNNPCPEPDEEVSCVPTEETSWPPPVQALRQPAPLFIRLEDGGVEEEYARLEG
jgi:hypothetical protein